MKYTAHMKAAPDSFVLLVPNPWGDDALDLVRQTHEEVWQQELGLTVDEAQVDGVAIAIVRDEPLPELVELAPTSLEPFGASALAMLEQHASIWRLVAEGGLASARSLLKFAGTLVESGASGVFLPNTLRLHSPRAVQRLTMELAPPALANFFVSAFDRDEWMRTRGLTALGMPEVETPVAGGLNAAYFRLMDLAAAMIAQGAPFPADSIIDLGSTDARLLDGPQGPDDAEVPVNGLHGVQSLIPRSR